LPFVLKFGAVKKREAALEAEFTISSRRREEIISDRASPFFVHVAVCMFNFWSLSSLPATEGLA
jgi:hypothetical protein